MKQFNNLGSINFIGFKRKTKRLILALIDFLSGFISWVIVGPPLASFLIDTNISAFLISIVNNFIGFLAPIITSLMYFYFNDIYKSTSRFYEPSRNMANHLIGSLVFGISWAVIYLYKLGAVDTNIGFIIVLQALIMSVVFFALIISCRLFIKIILNPYKKDIDSRPIIIFGAGSSGIELFYLLQSDPSTKVIAFMDDNQDIAGMKIDGIEVYSSIKKIRTLISEHESVEVYLAIPGIELDQRRKIIERLQSLNVSVRTIPSIHELVGDHKRMDELQDLSLDDLLPQDRAESMREIDLSNQTLMITGAGGSIGSELVRQALYAKPKIIILVDFSEYHLFKVYEEIIGLKKVIASTTELVPILHDITNETTLLNVIKEFSIDCIYHAAAYKHVPMLERSENTLVGIRNNIMGTYSICKLASKLNVKKVVMISTDKAVRPTNLMGATKRFAEQIIQYFDTLSSKNIFTMVRFGNVINSSGSVVPTFLEQIRQGGPVTITDFQVTRYFMTIPEASNLVLQAGEMANGGDVFILDMGEQIEILELAKRLINLKGYNYSFQEEDPGIMIVETGLRSGEKLYEELLISGTEMGTSNSKIFKSIEPSSDDTIIKLADEIQDHILNNDINSCMKILTENVQGFNR
jgi:FlaA1/EpsC-like NDP-sugar epimerase